MARHVNGRAAQSRSRRTAQQLAVVHVDAEVRWQDMYAKRRMTKRATYGMRNRSVIELTKDLSYHFTKGYRGSLQRRA